MADSVLGSLCREAECIWRRRIDIRRAQQRCFNIQLVQRLQNEFDSLSLRSLEIQKISVFLKRQAGMECLCLSLLDEIIRRSLLVSSQQSMARS